MQSYKTTGTCTVLLGGVGFGSWYSIGTGGSAGSVDVLEGLKPTM